MESLIKELGPSDFPYRLKEISDPPKKLFIKGEMPPEDYKWLCVVGARKYSSYGKETCRTLISGLRGLPVVIVSGLALGIDSIAHKTALENDLVTVGIPGSGLQEKVLYPSMNRLLAKQIIEKGGALISEFEPDFKATNWSFPQRNRIMAGLSDAVLIIEAEIKSGTLITSRLATEYNRDVFAVPGSIFSENSAGPHMLIRKGALAIDSANTLREALGFTEDKQLKFSIKNYENCSPEEKMILEKLSSPMSRSELIDSLDIPLSKINAVLSVLEIKGLIKEELGELHRI
jgi:DNA processing protein